MTPTPATAGAERESDAAFLDRVEREDRGRQHWDHDKDRLCALARRTVAVAVAVPPAGSDRDKLTECISGAMCIATDSDELSQTEHKELAKALNAVARVLHPLPEEFVEPAGAPGLSAAELDAIEARARAYGERWWGAFSPTKVLALVVMARDSLRQDDCYRAGLMRAAEIAEQEDRTGCTDDEEGTPIYSDGQDIAAAIHAEAASPAPPVAGPEPVAWQHQLPKECVGRWSNSLPTRAACEVRVSVYEDQGSGPLAIRPLYAAPPAPVPAGEVTEEMVDAAEYAMQQIPAGARPTRAMLIVALRAALAAKETGR